MGEPLSHLGTLLLGEKHIRRLYTPKGFVNIPYRVGGHLIYPHGWSVAILAAVALVPVLFWSRSGSNAITVLGLVGVLLVYPHAIIVWHGDSMEVQRHSLLNAVQLRLGIWLLILGTVDLLLQLRTSRRCNARGAAAG
jgi:hypothetical protein